MGTLNLHVLQTQLNTSVGLSILSNLTRLHKFALRSTLETSEHIPRIKIFVQDSRRGTNGFHSG